ncbi:hypothetical protein GC176_05435 [bacterium]|nr:hypothetical protein [bacterium]
MSSLTTERHDSSPAEKTSTPVRNKTARLTVGTAIRVHNSVNSPDFPDVSFGDWTGKIVEVSGRKAPFRYFVEWDDAVVAKIPQSYVDRCEEQQIYFRWACLNDSQFEAIG